MRTSLALVALVLVAPGCGGAQAETTARRRPRETPAEAVRPANDQGRCEVGGADREVSEYDTSGDEIPDVRRVYVRRGRPPLVRLILACREADLNGDGIKDVFRFYSDQGRPVREEADRDFDGRIDSVSFFQDGRVVLQELDTTGNGRVDTKIFFERGRVVRTERDLAGRSSESQWRPDRWEYFERGRMVRMGTDLTGDGNVDRWDRDARWAEEQRQLDEQAGTVGDDEEQGETSSSDE